MADTLDVILHRYTHEEPAPCPHVHPSRVTLTVAQVVSPKTPENEALLADNMDYLMTAATFLLA